MIFPVTTDGQVVMVEQYRHGAGKTLLELPAGNIDTDDINVQTALEAAQRELQEETGYTADEWLPLGYFHMDANRKAGAFYAFLAKSARQTHPPDLHETELIQTKLIDLADLRQLWMAHHFENVSTAAVVGLALATLDAMNTKDTP
jgi:8-oxo-dGTP pyrophosphatase MutT (NUDIX family)